jgi:hypothetical protein
MRKISQTGLLLILAVIFTGNIKSHAQVAELGNMMAAGAADAKILLQPYITPAVNAFGAALAGGWYNTAEPHKLGGFDLTFTANVAIIPKKYETFIINNDKLSLLKLADPAKNLSQTVAGENIAGPNIVYNVKDANGNVIYTQPAFTMPSGLNSNYIPAPMIQAGIGLIKGTEVMVRFLPNVKISDNEIGLWGLGGKHDIKQWIPGLKKLPVLQMSIMYGYTKLHTFIALDVDKNSIGAGSIPGEETNTWDDQYMKIVVQSQTANLLVAANLKVVCFYGGIGFVTTKTNLKLDGDFPIVQIPDGEIMPVVAAITNPIDMEIKNQNGGGVTKPRLNAGIRFKLAIITLHFDYSWANYNVLTAGLGFSFR